MMKREYDLSNIKGCPNPFSKQLNKQVTLLVGIEIVEYFEKKAKEKGISYQELMGLYLQDCITNQRELSFD